MLPAMFFFQEVYDLTCAVCLLLGQHPSFEHGARRSSDPIRTFQTEELVSKSFQRSRSSVASMVNWRT